MKTYTIRQNGFIVAQNLTLEKAEKLFAKTCKANPSDRVSLVEWSNEPKGKIIKTQDRKVTK